MDCRLGYFDRFEIRKVELRNRLLTAVVFNLHNLQKPYKHKINQVVEFVVWFHWLLLAKRQAPSNRSSDSAHGTFATRHSFLL